MNVRWIHVCDHALVDSNNKMSIIGIFKQFNVQSLPAMLPSFFIAFELELHGSEVGKPFDVRVEIVDADGQQIATMGGQMQLSGDRPPPGISPSIGHAVRVQSLQVKRIGTHEVNVFVNNRREDGAQFDVVRTQPPTPPEIPGQ